MAINTKGQLTALAEEIRDEEQPGGNTRLRVYTILKNMIDSMGSADGSKRPLILCAGTDFSSGDYPETGGTGLADDDHADGWVQRGNIFPVSIASPEDGNGDVKFPPRCWAIAMDDDPGQDDSKWNIIYA